MDLAVIGYYVLRVVAAVAIVAMLALIARKLTRARPGEIDPKVTESREYVKEFLTLLAAMATLVGLVLAVLEWVFPGILW